ncbi:response regulator [Bizionia saleffrena]|uniref:histidine kinase n=1 Tax=Bizionia saleffrena TaxID=291189 RepID=A0A8H2LGF8_9FLAO|nr:response regulator [Bizionia saleffrena]
MYISNKLSVFIILFFCLISSVSNGQERIAETIIVKTDQLILRAQNDIDTYHFFDAQQNLDSALILAKKSNNSQSLGIIYSKLGKLQFIFEENDEAIKTLIKAIEIQRDINDYANLATTYNTIGRVYLSIKDYNNALDYFISAATFYEQENLLKLETQAQLNTGKAYLALENYEKATNRFQNVILVSKQFQYNKLLCSATLHMAQVLTHTNQLDAALEKAQIAYDIANNNNYKSLLDRSYFVLSQVYEKRGDLQKSNDNLKKYIHLSDSLLSVKRGYFYPQNRRTSLKNNFTDYISETEAEIQKRSNKNTFDQLTTILSIALITILSLLTLSLYKNNNIRLKSNNVLHKKNAELIIAKENAELASKTKANFLSTVTHELRTPLYAVTGLTNMLLDESPKPEQIPHLKSLKFSGEYLLTFINDILQINKIEANKVDVDPEIFNLKKKMSNVISALNNSALDNNIILHLDYDKELPLNYNADQLKISQILINLIGNAIKFTKDGDIRVRAKKVNEENGTYNIRFEVEDNGIGISKEKQDHMFESFSQGSIQINRKYGGTGLGLSIVKGLIDILKGNIYLKSALGKGTTFYFDIPMEHTDEIIKEKKTNYFKDISEIDLTKIKILVVEDNKINQMITKKILNKMKLNCDVVDNGEEAVDIVKTTKYDVVLMDIHMPGISGIEATKIIRTFDKELTIFALTAVTIEDKMQEFDDAGFTDIISKPFKQEDFEKKLYNALITPEA